QGAPQLAVLIRTARIDPERPTLDPLEASSGPTGLDADGTRAARRSEGDDGAPQLGPVVEDEPVRLRRHGRLPERNGALPPRQIDPRLRIRILERGLRWSGGRVDPVAPSLEGVGRKRDAPPLQPRLECFPVDGDARAPETSEGLQDRQAVVPMHGRGPR